MNPISEETLQAYVDGELDAAEVARIDAALAHDALLARRVAQVRSVRVQLKSLFDPVLDEPVPGKLSALLQPASHSGFDRGRRRTSPRWLVPGMAVAASLAVLAMALWWNAGSSLVHTQGGQRFAAGALSRALDRSLASAPDPSAAVSIGVTFRSVDGAVCRTFVHRASPAMAGLACHQAAGWSLPVLGTPAKPEAGELRQAASHLPPAVQAAVDARIRGDAFNAQQERAARDAGWR